jgi:hypothetical protein
MAGITISRSIYINRSANWGRWLDTFTNTTRNADHDQKIAFWRPVRKSGQLRPNSSTIVNSSRRCASDFSGHMGIRGDPSRWNKHDRRSSGKSKVSLGNGRVRTMTCWNWFDDTQQPASYSGHDGNEAYVHTLMRVARQERRRCTSLFWRTRHRRNSRFQVEATAGQLAASPQISDMTPTEICSIANFKVTSSCTDKEGALFGNRRRRNAKKAETTAIRRLDAVHRPASRARCTRFQNKTTVDVDCSQKQCHTPRRGYCSPGRACAAKTAERSRRSAIIESLVRTW